MMPLGRIVFCCVFVLTTLTVCCCSLMMYVVIRRNFHALSLCFASLCQTGVSLADLVQHALLNS